MEGGVGASPVEDRLVCVLHEILDVSHLVVYGQQLLRVDRSTHLDPAAKPSTLVSNTNYCASRSQQRFLLFQLCTVCDTIMVSISDMMTDITHARRRWSVCTKCRDINMKFAKIVSHCASLSRNT